MAKKKITEFPEFASADEEREWWAKHNGEIDWESLPIEESTFDIEPAKRRKRAIATRGRSC